MSTDLFTSLKKYRPTDGKNSVENFITEAFAWLLRFDKGFALEYFNKIIVLLGDKKKFPDLSGPTLQWSTQVNFKGKFPDLVCSFGENYAIVFEHKAFVHLHENQLQNYRDTAIEFYSNNFAIVLVTANITQHEQNPDAAICWSQIHLWISEWLQNHPENKLFFESFQRLLEYEGLGPNPPISHTAILYYNQVKNFNDALWGVICRAFINTKEKLSLLIPLEEMYFETQAGWGRWGICSFGNDESKWKPGIFFGVMLDGIDHQVKPMSENGSPDCVFIISFSENCHELYPKLESYKKLSNDLSELVKKDFLGWEYYQHLEDEAVDNPNRWHPLYFRMPLLELLRGTRTSEDQDQIFRDIILNKIPLIWSLESFQQLRNEL